MVWFKTCDNTARVVTTLGLVRHALSNHQHVVILMHDVRHIAERLTHALTEGVDPRAESVI